MTRALAAVLCLFLPSLALAQRTHDITLDDYFTLAVPFEIAAGPDGVQVAYTEARWQLSTNDRKADLWVTDGRGSRRLTFDRPGARSPQWSADGKEIYFLASRAKSADKPGVWEGKTQVWRIPARGGEPLAITRSAEGVEAYALASNGRSLVYLTHHQKISGELAKLKKQFGGIEYGHGVNKVSQVHRLDLESWREKTVLKPGRYVREMALAPDGKKLALITAPDETVVSSEGRSRVEVADLTTGKSTPLPEKAYRTPTPYAWLEHLAWSPDGRRLAWNAIFDGYPAEIIVAEEQGEKGFDVWKLARTGGLMVQGYGSPLAWQGSELCFLADEKARLRLCSVRILGPDKQDSPEIRTPGDVVVNALSIHNGKPGQIALVAGTPTLLREVQRLSKTEGKWSRTPLTKLNMQTETWKWPTVSVVRWKGAGGKEVEGVLEVPAGHKKGEKLPLIVALHGGPTTAVYYQRDFDMYLGRALLPAKGYAVLCPNYRGSTGYGDGFVTDLVGKENGVEVEDILKGVDHLVAEGLADPNRLGVMGWSNGGYLTNCVIAKTPRFKAASSGAGIVDTVMQWGVNDEPAYMVALKGGLPWQKAEVYKRTSTTYQLNRIVTPTLIHVGGNDERCPPGHSRMLYRALHEYNKVPTELLVYTGEPHGLGKASNRRAKMAWELAWFARYILGRGKK